MRILLLGKTGLLGTYFFNHFLGFSPGVVYAPTKQELNLENYDEVESYISRIRPTVVINCSGYTAVDDAEENKDLAFKINAEVAGKLASFCKKVDGVLIHFSTDYVFDGQKKEGYGEDDDPSPLNLYGKSKLSGEDLIKSNTDKYYIIRTSWLFGEYGKNFVTTMLNLADHKKELDVVDDQIGSPTYAKDLALFVSSNFLDDSHLPFGVYHLTNSGVCSWYDFAVEIFKIAGKNIVVNKVDSSAFPRPAKRPNYSILVNNKLEKGLRDWNTALKAFLSLANLNF